MLEEGYIKLYRSLLRWEWYEDINVTRLFIHLLLVANRKSEKWQGIDVGRGQRITGRKKLAEQTGLTEMEIRTALAKLKSTGEISIKTTKKYSLITINNYDEYQGDNQRNNQQSANEQPTINQRLTTNGESKKARKQEEKGQGHMPKIPFGEFGRVMLKPVEYEKLVGKYPRKMVDDKIADLDSRIQAGEKKYVAYVDHYATLGKWCRKDAPSEEPPPDYTIKPDTSKLNFEGMNPWEILGTLDD